VGGIKYNWVPLYEKIFQVKNMVYRLTAKDRVFCEGTLSECEECLTGISQMIHAGIKTDFEVTDFLIVNLDNPVTVSKNYDGPLYARHPDLM